MTIHCEGVLKTLKLDFTFSHHLPQIHPKIGGFLFSCSLEHHVPYPVAPHRALNALKLDYNDCSKVLAWEHRAEWITRVPIGLSLYKLLLKNSVNLSN